MKHNATKIYASYKLCPTLSQTAALGKATASFTHAATACANARGKALCDITIAAGTLSVLGAISDNSNAINSCEG